MTITESYSTVTVFPPGAAHPQQVVTVLHSPLQPPMPQPAVTVTHSVPHPQSMPQQTVTVSASTPQTVSQSTVAQSTVAQSTVSQSTTFVSPLSQHTVMVVHSAAPQPIMLQPGVTVLQPAWTPYHPHYSHCHCIC
ncbi:MAG: hypothetical protein VKL39_05015 [Leptolyngbyaceae bacterium]|nr:hypothetical protein [Leptolyngbyaceae bacterium]